MFGKKSDSVKTYEQVQNKYLKKESTKPCSDCGCVVVIEKVKQVKHSGLYRLSPTFYCDRCKPPYDEIRHCLNGTIRYFQYIPEHSVEVTQGGKKIVEKKKK